MGNNDAKILSAFYGSDDVGGLNPFGFPSPDDRDGMPVVFAQELDQDTLDSADFKITTESGAVYYPNRATLSPADGEGENSTVLMLGEFGSADDQPISVEIVGDLYSLDNDVNYKGESIGVVPLESGPSLVNAKIVSTDLFDTNNFIGEIPENGLVVQTTWDGGVTKPNGQELNEDDLQYFTATFLDENVDLIEAQPAGMSDLDDGDNHQLPYFEFDEGVNVETLVLVSVSVEGGFVTDPNDDVNDASEVIVTTQEVTEEIDISKPKYQLSENIDSSKNVLEAHSEEVISGTLNFNDSNNIIILDGQAKTYRGLTGDDTYFVSQLLPKNVKVSITDTEGLNIIQIPSNTYVDESLFTKNAVRLTLEDGREITINGADKFTYNVGGNVTDGTAGIDLTYSDFATSFGISDVLNSSDAQTGVISDMYII